MIQTHPATSWQAHPSGPVRTTHAGRLALPIAISLGGSTVALVDVVLDGEHAAALYRALGEHLCGRGAVVTSEAAS